MHAAYLHGLDQTARDALDKQEPKLDSCIVAAIVSPVASYIGRRQQLATSASPDDVSELLKFADTLRASMDGDIRPLSELGAKEAPMVKKWLEVAVVQATSLLNDDHERAISKLVSEAPADRPDTFDDQLFQGQDRVYFQLPKPESKIAAEIERHLIAGGYKDMDYQAGTVINPQGPITKIGRALQRVGQMELRDAYAKDPARASDMIVMISRDPEDIARMSTKRKWDSCMNPSHYRFGRHVTADLQEGTAIAYLLKPNDVNAVNPIARIALKPYRNEEGEVLMVPNRTFGLTRTPFADFVRDVADTYVNEGKTGVFKIHHDLGTDDLASEVERFPDGRIVSEITLEPNIQAGEPVRKLPDGTTAKRGMRVAI
ncbi:MAG: hypothetical protein KI792_08705 [Alphaproteobacteria bacterium]|nr:hypothetical protein [Alphaproteobacteria bacterium SS10]